MNQDKAYHKVKIQALKEAIGNLKHKLKKLEKELERIKKPPTP